MENSPSARPAAWIDVSKLRPLREAVVMHLRSHLPTKAAERAVFAVRAAFNNYEELAESAPHVCNPPEERGYKYGNDWTCSCGQEFVLVFDKEDAARWEKSAVPQPSEGHSAKDALAILDQWGEGQAAAIVRRELSNMEEK